MGNNKDIGSRLAKNNSRTTNTIYNFTTSIGGQLITIVMQFVVRTVFIHTLGKSFLGINGLFSNILSMLSLAELGVGSAILYQLYEPIQKEDHQRIIVLMKFYKAAYRVIAIAVAVIGLCLIPFLPVLVNDYEKFDALQLNAAFIFILYLFKTVSTYLFFAYRSAIVKANQKEYILNLNSYLFTIGSGIVQIICLLLFKNFELYVFIMVIEVVGLNFVNALLANKMYPYIRQKTEESLSKEEVKGIFKDCGALFIYKINAVVVKASDNIVLSTFLGLDAVGIYSNYYIFYTTIRTLYVKIFNSVSHSLGNLHAEKNVEHEYQIFESTMLISAILGGTAFVGIFAVGDELVNVWIGKEWLIKQPFAFLMGLELFTAAYKTILSKYRTTMGLFQQAKFRPVAGMIINLVVSIALVLVGRQYSMDWAISGVLVGTIASDWLTFMWYDPWVIYRESFKDYKIKTYYLKFLKYFVISLAVGIGDFFLCKYCFTGWGWISVIIHCVICGVTTPAALILVSIRQPEGKYIWKTIQNTTKKVIKKITRKKNK